MVSDLPQLLIPPVELAKYSKQVLKVLSKVVTNCKDLTVTSYIRAFLNSFIFGMHHLVPNVDISLQSGRF